jgi:hypothetical protein
LEVNGALTIAENKLNHISDRAVAFVELPIEIKNQIRTIKLDFIKQAMGIGFVSGLVLILAWEYQTRIGFYVSKPCSWRKPSWGNCLKSIAKR